MLILTRKAGESIVIGDNITVKIVEVDGDQVKLGIEAPRNIEIYRQEIYNQIQKENLLAAGAKFPALDMEKLRQLGTSLKQQK